MARILYIEDQEEQIKDTVITVIEVECEAEVILVDSPGKAIEELNKFAEDPIENVLDLVIVDVLLSPDEEFTKENSVFGLVRYIKELELNIVVVSGILGAPAPAPWIKKTVREVFIEDFDVPREMIFHKPPEMDKLVSTVNFLLSKGNTRT